MKLNELIEGVDYYINQDGFLVLTEKYHLEKGYCCGLGCLHCPYNYENVAESQKTILLKKKLKKEKNNLNNGFFKKKRK